jgi:hypothetical protein
MKKKKIVHMEMRAITIGAVARGSTACGLRSTKAKPLEITTLALFKLSGNRDYEPCPDCVALISKANELRPDPIDEFNRLTSEKTFSVTLQFGDGKAETSSLVRRFQFKDPEGQDWEIIPAQAHEVGFEIRKREAGSIAAVGESGNVLRIVGISGNVLMGKQEDSADDDRSDRKCAWSNLQT